MKLSAICLVSMAATTFFVSSCGSGGKEKTRDFASAQEFLDNHHVAEALQKAGFALYQGDEPPLIEGLYERFGWEIACLQDQTDSGTIEYETDDGSKRIVRSYVTGEGDNFTIWQEGEWFLDISCPKPYMAILYSGTKLVNGDIQGHVLWVRLENFEPVDVPDCQIGTYEKSDLEMHFYTAECTSAHL